MNNYRDELVETIKLMGQELIDRAESMVHEDCDMITNFNINIDIPQPMDGHPELTWSTSTLCKNFYNKEIGHSAGDAKMETHIESVTVEKKEPAAMYISYVDSINCYTVFECPRCGAVQRFDGILYGENRFCDICNR